MQPDLGQSPQLTMTGIAGAEEIACHSPPPKHSTCPARIVCVA